MKRGWLRINASVPAYSQLHQMFVILVIQALVLSTAEVCGLSTLELSAWQSLASKLDVPLIEILPNFQAFGTRAVPTASETPCFTYPTHYTLPNHTFATPLANISNPPFNITTFSPNTILSNLNVSRPSESLLTKRKPQGSIAVTLNLKRRKLDTPSPTGTTPVTPVPTGKILFLSYLTFRLRSDLCNYSNSTRDS